ncbi:MAG: hypothetical protein AMXMBFR7_44650 [Planctomycetota bacterium]
MGISASIGRAAIQAALLPVAAVGLGLVFNHSHPLGVRWQDPSATAMPVLAPTPKSELQSNTIFPEESALDTSRAQAVPRQGAVYAQEDVHLSVENMADKELVIPLGVSLEEIIPKQREGRILLVDGRPTAAFKAGHIDGSISLPINELDSAVPAFKRQYGPETPIVVYCGNKNCAIAAKVATVLAQVHGFTRVSYLHEGYAEWRLAVSASESGRQMP